MNHRGGWALIVATWSSWLQHRGFFFTLAFGWMMPPMVYLFVWSTSAGEGTIGGFTRGEFIGYYLVLVLVNQMTYSQTNWTVGDLIRHGQLTPLLLRPMSPVYNTVSSELAGKVVYMSFVVPVTAVLALVLRPSLHVTMHEGLAFVPALVLAWALRFAWGYWLALLAFWVTRADALLGLQDALVFLLGGQVAPTSLLPQGLQQVAAVLPFRYMVGFPVEVLAGHLESWGLLAGLAAQVGWLAVTLLLWRLVWRRGLRHYTAVGG
jgi:ABC-2 type transport system permease protein